MVLIYSSTFGLALLAILGACLLHLVATAYFFLLEILGERVNILETRKAVNFNENVHALSGQFLLVYSDTVAAGSFI